MTRRAQMLERRGERHGGWARGLLVAPGLGESVLNHAGVARAHVDIQEAVFTVAL